ncbi:transcriptional regulator [Actinobacillus succinogenes]|uniref:Putative transcriptional regulator n=1 Tax=Actinobacillus succinogenes (strain ATCC 55618 / DSM 22257 / CCUG 43843 / 130Z) TaxID=339671 RepID=A6VMI5_ACTSZ|nr:RNA-binding domain-containing protein [Actinobacillus succinogenes]ABR74182.1 putative transcriptional regulator [Actinobacillus succinogenes 130Z]PHI39388.1 transcriptional regulator [Actinobacillus succinogenes]
MKKDELLEILRNGENSIIEFKRDDIRPEQLAKEIVAMANFMGGKILLGVEDDGSISGIQRKNLEEWVINVFQNKVHPIILPFYETVDIDGKKIAVIEFPAGISKPYVMKHNGKEEIYIRLGSSSRLATREQQARLFQLGGMLHAEIMPVPNTSMDSLDFARLENYLSVVLRDPEVPLTKDEWKNRLLNLGFITESNDTIYCTIAGLVLFGKSPHRQLRQSGLRLMVFDSKDKVYQAKLDTLLDSAIVGRIDTDKTIIEKGLIEKALELLAPFISEESDSIDENARRVKKWLYPWEALREVLANAVAHRDWTRFIEIDVIVYSDRLEVISPGILPNSMTIEKMKAGQRSPRNTIIMEVMKDYGYVDSRGMGVRTKIVPLVREASGKDPDFILTEDYLKTVFYKR